MTILSVRREALKEDRQMVAEAPVVPRPQKTCFMVQAWDGPDASHLRERDLVAHLAHVETYWQDYLIAGPLRAADVCSGALCGSLLMIYADDEPSAWRLLEGDPYFTNGQYQRVEMWRFAPSIGLAIGGKTWPNAAAITAWSAPEIMRDTSRAEEG
jgi:uncharacterized protein YciI